MQKSVLLGFSGGIDSCTAARLLRTEGYRVVAITIDTTSDSTMLQRAKSRAEELDIEWYAYDARELFRREIIDYFCQEYSLGHTPAPCTRCNVLIKWNILLSEANRLGIDHISTGHYFNIATHNNRYYVTKGSDPAKDQSYYLWGLTQEVLSRAITPMGTMIKSEIKEGFSDKSESMGICFLEGKPYAEYLEQHGVTMTPGNIVTPSGAVCGHHNGIARYTIGQRRGEGIPSGKRIIAIDATNNTLIAGDIEQLYKSKLYITNHNIIDPEELLSATDITIKIRGIGKNPESPVHVERWHDGYMITTPDQAYAPAKGQPLVFYRNNRVIGGGIVVGFE